MLAVCVFQVGLWLLSDCLLHPQPAGRPPFLPAVQTPSARVQEVTQQSSGTRAKSGNGNGITSNKRYIFGHICVIYKTLGKPDLVF